MVFLKNIKNNIRMKTFFNYVKLAIILLLSIIFVNNTKAQTTTVGYDPFPDLAVVKSKSIFSTTPTPVMTGVTIKYTINGTSGITGSKFVWHIVGGTIETSGTDDGNGNVIIAADGSNNCTIDVTWDGVDQGYIAVYEVTSNNCIVNVNKPNASISDADKTKFEAAVKGIRVIIGETPKVWLSSVYDSKTTSICSGDVLGEVKINWSGAKANLPWTIKYTDFDNVEKTFSISTSNFDSGNATLTLATDQLVSVNTNIQKALTLTEFNYVVSTTSQNVNSYLFEKIDENKFKSLTVNVNRLPNTGNLIAN